MSALQALPLIWCAYLGDALRFASRLPLAFIFRAFGADVLNGSFDFLD